VVRVTDRPTLWRLAAGSSVLLKPVVVEVLALALVDLVVIGLVVLVPVVEVVGTLETRLACSSTLRISIASPAPVWIVVLLVRDAWWYIQQCDAQYITTHTCSSIMLGHGRPGSFTEREESSSLAKRFSSMCTNLE
jgi:hypothetical protein